MVAGIMVGKWIWWKGAGLWFISTVEPTEFAIDWTVRCERVQLRKTPMFWTMKKMELTFTKMGKIRGPGQFLGRGIRNLVFILPFCSTSLRVLSWVLISATWVSGRTEVIWTGECQPFFSLKKLLVSSASVLVSCAAEQSSPTFQWLSVICVSVKAETLIVCSSDQLCSISLIILALLPGHTCSHPISQSSWPIPTRMREGPYTSNK